MSDTSPDSFPDPDMWEDTSQTIERILKFGRVSPHEGDSRNGRQLVGTLQQVVRGFEDYYVNASRKLLRFENETDPCEDHISIEYRGLAAEFSWSEGKPVTPDSVAYMSVIALAHGSLPPPANYEWDERRELFRLLPSAEFSSHLIATTSAPGTIHPSPTGETLTIVHNSLGGVLADLQSGRRA
jgi:hypothetical protein